MPRTCKACGSPNRREIDHDLANGVPLRTIAGRVKISHQALLNHKNAHITTTIQEVVAERKAQAKLTAEMVLDRLRLHGFYDPGQFFDEHGTLKDINQMDPDARAVIRGFDYVNLYEGDGDQKHLFGQLRKIRTTDQIAALKALGQHFGLFPTAPAPVQQNNFQQNIYLRSPEDLDWFIAHGKWPEEDDADSGRIGPAGAIVGSDSPKKD